MAEQETVQPQGKPKKPIFKRVWFWIIVVVVIIVIAVSASGGSDEPASGGSDNGGGTTQEQAAQEPAADIEIYNQDGIVITVGAKDADFMGCLIPVTITNNSGNNISVMIDGVSVDGLMVDVWFYEDVTAGMTAKADLSTLDITSLDDFINIKGNITIINSDNFATIGTGTLDIA